MIKTMTLAIVLSLGWTLTSLAQSAGTWFKGRYSADINLEYQVYVPASINATEPRPLILMMAGCTQSTPDFNALTGMSELAEQRGAILLFPEQNSRYNFYRCWNWFEPRHQQRGQGEPGAFMGMIEELRLSYPVDDRRIYVVGFSAGAGMANIMTSCYPEVFRAGVIHSGTGFGSAQTMGEAFTTMNTGSSRRPADMARMAYECGRDHIVSSTPVPLMVVHGSADYVVNSKNGDQVVDQLISQVDLLDDGEINQSQVYSKGEVVEAREGRGYPYFIRDYTLENKPLLVHVGVTGLGHAWSGGRSGYAYSDPRGPNLAGLIWAFFMAQNDAP